MKESKYLQEAKKRLTIVFLAFVIAFAGFWVTSDQLILMAEKFYQVSWMAIKPYEVYFVKAKISAVLSLIMVFPLFIYQIYRFTAPGLKMKEKKILKKSVPLVIVLTYAGALLGMTLNSQVLLSFLYASQSAVTSQWTLSGVISFVSMVTLVSSLFLNIPLLVYSSLDLGIVSVEKLKEYLMHLVALSFLVSALVTPPDPLSMTVLALLILGFVCSGVFMYEIKR